MTRWICIAVWVAMAANGFCEDRGGTPKEAMRPGGAKRAGGALKKEGLPKAGPPLRNPGNPAVRLYRATPEERERALEKLPPAMQQRMRKELDWFDHLAPDQQQVIINRAQRMEALPPEKRVALRQSWQEFQQLPQDRKRMVAAVIRRLQVANEEQRNRFLKGRFVTDFSAEEQKIILDLSEAMQPGQ